MTRDEAVATLAQLDKFKGNKAHAASAAGLSRDTFKSRVDRAKVILGTLDFTEIEVPTGDPLPPKLLPIADIIEQHEKAFEQRRAHSQALLWRRFHVPVRGPYALMFFGDPHLDDDGCDLTLFKSHAELAARTKALYAVNIGDSTNNWAGRLSHLWADQNTGAEVARALVKHYLADSGIPWFLWLCGNHDLFDGPVGREVFEHHAPHFVQMTEWQAKVTLVSPNGHELRLWAAHNFRGNSIYNNLHGLERAAQMADWAHLYVAGHHHDCGTRQGENASRRFVYNLMRVRGYKFLDHYGEIHQFPEYQYGSAGVAIVDPDANKLNAVTTFLDPFEGADFLAWKRRNISA